LPADVCDRLARAYGTEYARVVTLIREDPSLAQPLGRTCGVTRGEVLYAVRHEMAMRLSDVIMRRTEAGSAAHPGRDALAAAAAIIGGELGWDVGRVNDEIADVERRYQYD
jgi:glycerol-3-phosphate dehydrogenase